MLADARAKGVSRDMTQLPVEKLRRGRYQPRTLKDDPALNELAESIREFGVIEPIAVRPTDDQSDTYEILAGDRRWRAAQKIGLDQIPVIIHEVDDKTAAAIALVENLQREDLNPIEEAVALRRLMEDFNLNQSQVGELVSKSESAVSKSLGLLKLLPQVQTMIQQGELEAGHGKVLLNVDSAEQLLLAEKTVKFGWSVRELERQKVALMTGTRRRKSVTRDIRNPDLKRLEVRLEEWFCAPVKVKPNRRGGGKIEIAYASPEECDNILQRCGLQASDTLE